MHQDGAQSVCQDCGAVLVFSVSVDEYGVDGAEWAALADNDPGCEWHVITTGESGFADHTPDEDAVVENPR
jgi:hypothetical protein